MKTVADVINMIHKTGKVSYERPGVELWRAFRDSERYIIDFAPDFKSDGWEQFDTDQDAAYFGVWVNINKKMILTYAEGDWMLEIGSGQAFRECIERIINFYREGRIALVIDGNTGEEIEVRQDRSKLLKMIQ